MPERERKGCEGLVHSEVCSLRAGICESDLKGRKLLGLLFPSLSTWVLTFESNLVAPCLKSKSLRLSIGVNTGVPAAGEGAQLGSLRRPPSAAALNCGLTGEQLCMLALC